LASRKTPKPLAISPGYRPISLMMPLDVLICGGAVGGHAGRLRALAARGWPGAGICRVVAGVGGLEPSTTGSVFNNPTIGSIS
jgi:hypothetical protein